MMSQYKTWRKGDRREKERKRGTRGRKQVCNIRGLLQLLELSFYSIISNPHLF